MIQADGAAVAKALGGRRSLQCSRADAVASGDPFLVEHDGRCFVFNPGETNEAALAAQFEELCVFVSEQEALRYRDGVLVRAVRQVDGVLVHEGRRGQKREPDVDTLDSAALIAFARAWHCDPEVAWASGRVHRISWRRRGAARAADWGRARGFTQQQRNWAGIALLVFLGLIVVVVQRIERDQDRMEAIERCHQEEDCRRCSVCSNRKPHPCAGLSTACVRDADCKALMDCFEGCGDDRVAAFEAGVRSIDFECDQVCIASHPDGVPAFSAWARCVYCDACSGPCGWLKDLGGRGDLILANCPPDSSGVNPGNPLLERQESMP